MKNQIDLVKVFATGLPHPEGIAIDKNGWLYTGCALPDYAGKGPVYKISPDGKEINSFSDTQGRVLGLTFRPDGMLFVCDVHNQAVICIDRSGNRELFSDFVDGRKIQKPNFLVFDRSGNLYVSDSGSAKAGESTGAIYRFSPDGKGEIFLDHLVYPNGIALDEQEQHLFIVLTRDNALLKVPILQNGQAGSTRLFAENLNNGPDGVSISRTGRIFTTVTRPSQIVELSKIGKRLTYVLDKDDRLLAAPSNIAFGGEKQEDLFIANLFGHHIAYMKLNPQ